mgnify:CR=1 FL=1
MPRNAGRPRAANAPARTALYAPHAAAWQEACARHGPTADDRGLRPATIEKRDAALRRFYAFLDAAGRIDPRTPLIDHVTADTVAAYARHLADASGHSRYERVRHVYEAASMLGRPAHLQAVDEIRRTLKFERGADRPPKQRPDVPDREAALTAALDAAALAAEPVDAAGFRALRDVVALAVQADAALRHGELWQLTLDETLVRMDDSWLIALGGRRTKTRQAHYHTCLPAVGALLDTYRRHHAAWAATPALWIDPDYGTALSYGHLGRCFQRTCKRLLGRPYTVHVFRHAVRGDYARDPGARAEPARHHLNHNDTRTGRYTYLHLRPIDVMAVQAIVCPL